MLKLKQMQCELYAKHIQELEQKLSVQYVQRQKMSSVNGAADFPLLAGKTDNSKSECVSGEAHMPSIFTTEPMDEISCISSSFDAKLSLFTERAGKSLDGADENMLELQIALLEDKSNQLAETDTKLKAITEEVAVLRRELEASRKLLDESQMNCAHTENCLHEAREEAQTQKSSADRRASEYSLLRASVIKMCSFFERLKTRVYSPGGGADSADSLRNLARSLANSANDRYDDDIVEFRKCTRVLADKVSFLSRHREELHDKYTRMDAANEQLRKELEEKRDQVQTYYNKHQLDKQANKEKIYFGCLEVHEIAAFVLTPSGHYEAITKNSSNYYLSAESVTLITDHLSS